LLPQRWPRVEKRNDSNGSNGSSRGKKNKFLEYMLTPQQILYRTKQVDIARQLPDTTWLKFYVPESHMPRFPRADDASLSKREFHAEISKTKQHIRDMAATIRYNMGLPPVDSQYQYPRMPAKLDDATVAWRRRELKKITDLPNSTWLARHHRTQFPRPPNVHGAFSSKRHFHHTASAWRAAIKELADRYKK
jgi:hypothetical protein